MKYAQGVDINLNEDFSKVGMFGSGHWLITNGDNVHITDQCQSITHDGSTSFYEKKSQI